MPPSLWHPALIPIHPPRCARAPREQFPVGAEFPIAITRDGMLSALSSRFASGPISEKPARSRAAGLFSGGRCTGARAARPLPSSETGHRPSLIGSHNNGALGARPRLPLSKRTTIMCARSRLTTLMLSVLVSAGMVTASAAQGTPALRHPSHPSRPPAVQAHISSAATSTTELWSLPVVVTRGVSLLV